MRIKRYCKVPGCGKEYFCHEYCAAHFQHFLGIGAIPGQEKCKIKRCKTGAYAHGLCRLHYNRVRKRGTAFCIQDTYKNICKVFGCKEPSLCRGYCEKHYCRWQKYGNCYKRHQGLPRGKANWRWNGGVSEYPNHWKLKVQRKIKLNMVGWACELCGNYTNQVIHKNGNNADHRQENLMAICLKCKGNQLKGQRKASQYTRAYGLTLKEMSEAFGDRGQLYRVLHRAGKLRKFLLKAQRGVIDRG